ncbi:Na/Pi cotransporter [Anaerobacillus alkalidiazotrophicus]|uniref:Na/Pi cotransporter n=1 Tax=Anaerobacillus alkalidiazotrophicus TaxID=472963 RepID=A0A1S2MC28_9BACI|nr:Na/Pi symporter [Anaerobacillus alkalidiazotrophicus]OIJ22124.1 Na/Pi cotransporter [Anaerobacillus alkalidiazotrophicus]
MQQLFSLFAVYITIFLFGMTVMRAGLVNLSQDRLKLALIKMTSTPFKGLLVGTIVTAIVQSSSAVMVITVGLVAASYLTFKQSIGIILGTNIGTSFTTEIIAFNLTSGIIPMLIIGVILMNMKKHVAYCIGCVSFGLGCIFVAMQGLETLAYPIASIPTAHNFLQLTNENSFIAVGVGAVLSALIQSSTATTAIAMGFMSDQILALPAGIGIVLGANIGTCFTAILASVGSKNSAKLVAFAHIWLNIIGVLLFLPFIGWLSSISISLTALPNLQLAHAGTIFNIISSVAVLPFVPLFYKFVIALHGNEQK